MSYSCLKKSAFSVRQEILCCSFQKPVFFKARKFPPRCALQSYLRRWEWGEWKTNSQDHRMGKIGKDHWKSSSPTPCSSSVPWSRLLRTVSRQILSDSREGCFSATLSYQSFPALSHPYSKFVPRVQVELPAFQKMSFPYYKRYFVN